MNTLLLARARACMQERIPFLVWCNAAPGDALSKPLADLEAQLRHLHCPAIVVSASLRSAAAEQVLTVLELLCTWIPSMPSPEHLRDALQSQEASHKWAPRQLAHVLQGFGTKRPTWLEGLPADIIIVLDVFQLSSKGLALIDALARIMTDTQDADLPAGGKTCVVGVGDPYDSNHQDPAFSTKLWRKMFRRNFFGWRLPSSSDHTLLWQQSTRVKLALPGENLEGAFLYPEYCRDNNTAADRDGCQAYTSKDGYDSLKLHSWPVPAEVCMRAGDIALLLPGQGVDGRGVVCTVTDARPSSVKLRLAQADGTDAMLTIRRVTLRKKVLVGPGAPSEVPFTREAMPIIPVLNVPSLGANVTRRMEFVCAARPSCVLVNTKIDTPLLYSLRDVTTLRRTASATWEKQLTTRYEQTLRLAKCCERLGQDPQVGSKIKIPWMAGKQKVIGVGVGPFPLVYVETKDKKTLRFFRFLFDYDD